MLKILKIFASQSKKRTAPESRVPAHAVVRIGQKRPALLIPPQFPGPIAKILPDFPGAPVLLFLRNEISSLENENARRGAAKCVRNRAAARTAADDDDVVVEIHQV